MRPDHDAPPALLFPYAYFAALVHFALRLAAITAGFRAGAAGYLLKQTAGEELHIPIREVQQGHTYLTPLIAREVIAVMPGAHKQPAPDPPGEQDVVDGLSSRTREIFARVAKGRTMRQIAAALQLSARTVETHTAALIAYAIRQGLTVDERYSSARFPPATRTRTGCPGPAHPLL